MAHSKSEIKKAKNLLNKYAPKGEQLAYINPKEANLLKRIGGAGKDINGTGIKSYFDPGSGRGSVSESLSESAGLGSSSSSSSDDNSPQRQPASYRSVAPKTAAPQNILSKAGSGIVDYIKTGGTIGLIAKTVGKAINYVTKNIGGRMTRTQVNTNQARLSGSQIFDYQKKSMPSTTMGGGDNSNNMSASNVGGKIIKLAPTSAEVSQSKATDVTYDSRKTKARGRSMTIRTNSRGVGNNMASVLGKKSLLGAA